MRRLRVAAALLLVLIGADARAVECGIVQFRDQRYTLCEVDFSKDKLRLFLRDEAGSPFKRFEALKKSLAARGEQLVFAMNAGMYHPDFSAVGLFIAEGEEQAPLNTASGTGNFFLKPNGVFYITEKGAGVMEAERYVKAREKPLLATQSGPLLLQDGEVHPRFLPDSASRLVRNGVGIVSPQRAVFAISDSPVNFYEFALFFRDHLHCRDALYLDGNISSLYSEQVGRDDELKPLGPIIAVTAPLPNQPSPR